MPTSGTSGTPKLLIISDAMMLRQFTPPRFGVRTVVYSYQPIRQSFDTLVKGGAIGCWSGSLARLQDDMAALRPTYFASTPAFWQQLLQRFEMELRLERSSGDTGPARARCVARWRQKQLLGNRCKLVTIGGAGSSETAAIP